MKNLIIEPQDRILIVAPHPDDEIIGVGGLLISNASKCDVVLLTDGRLGHLPGEDDEHTALIRKQEFLNVMQAVNVHQFYYIGIHDNGVKESKKVIGKINLKGYTKIFVPNKNEWHIDHKYAYSWIRFYAFLKNRKAELIEYEVWSPISNPNYHYDISEYFLRKMELVNMYPSQLKCQNYCSQVEAINKYRSFILKTDYCEAYFSQRKAKKEKLHQRYNQARYILSIVYRKLFPFKRKHT